MSILVASKVYRYFWSFVIFWREDDTNSRSYCVAVRSAKEDCGSRVRSFGQWAVAKCAALPTANAGQYTTSHCKPLLLWFPCKAVNVPKLGHNGAIQSCCCCCHYYYYYYYYYYRQTAVHVGRKCNKF